MVPLILLSDGCKIHLQMDDNKSIVFSNKPVSASSASSAVIRAKSFKVNSPTHNFAQYINAIKAYALAGMPFEHIANAGEYLGDIVERGELDAPMLEGWENKMGETIEDESKILSWQNRGEVISIVPQIASPEPITGQEIVTQTQQITTSQPQEQKLNVLEGIAVYNQPPQPISATTDNQLENNPFLKPLPDQKPIT